MTRFNDILNGIKQSFSIQNPKSSGTYPENEYQEDRLNLLSEDENPESEMEMQEYKESYYEMSVGSLNAIMNHAKSILENLENPTVKENLTAPHLQGIIAVAEDHMRGIHDFVMYVSDASDNTDAASKPGLWENIRKKKEREGKKYRPAKPGDEDRPDPKQWKELTKAAYEYRCPKCGLEMQFNVQRSNYKCPIDGTTLQRD